MSGANNNITVEDLNSLLQIMYTASSRQNKLAVPGVNVKNAKCFKPEDIPTLAFEYNLPLPSSDLLDTLEAGVRRGIFQSTVEVGTQCGYNWCNPPTIAPSLIYAYNPNMLRVNSSNVIFTSPTIYFNTGYKGTVVRFANNRAPAYGTRGSAITTKNVAC